MIGTTELHKAIIAMLEKAGYGIDKYDVLFERNEVSSEESGSFLSETGEVFTEEAGKASTPKSYFYVTFNESRKTVDTVYCDRSIAISIEFYPQPDSMDDIDDGVLWNAADALENAIYPIFDVRDRHLTVIDLSHRIFEGALHFRFKLDFRDSRIVTKKADGSPLYEMMEHLDTKLVAEGHEIAFDADKEE